MPPEPSEHPHLSQQQAFEDVNIQGDDNIFNVIQGQVVTLTQTKIIQIAVEEIKTREFVITSPYKGLKKFEPEDRDRFFGRDQFIAGLVNDLEHTNFILLLGASGSGKSSVVRAGLIPWLQQKWGKLFVSLLLTPDRDPFESLYGSLLSRGYPQAQAQLARTATAETLSQVVKTLKAADDYWLLVIDQFEELFTVSEAEQRDRFLESLVKLSQAAPASVKIIATMRADFLDRLSPYAKLVKLTDRHRPLIAEMQGDELRLAIEQPAAHHGVVFETGLVEEIITAVQGQAGCLPLLQYTLDLLWESEVQDGGIGDRTLNAASYRRLGGVRGALNQRVQTIYEALSASEQLAVQRIFLKLVEIGGDAEADWKPVRRRALRSEFADATEQTVLTQLIDQNLLVSDAVVQQDGTDAVSTVEIAHEILLTSWSQLHEWIEANRQSIALRNRLNDDVARWQGKQSEDELWTGSRLAQVVELRQDSAFQQVLGGFSPSANQFIDASVKLRERQRQRQLRTAWGVAGGAIVALLVSSGLGLVAWNQTKQAELNQATSLGRYAQSLLSQGRDLDAFVQAIRSGKTLQKHHTTDPEVMRALQQVIYESRESNRLEGHAAKVLSVSFSPDNKTLASGSEDGTLKLWSVETGQELRTLKGHAGPIHCLSFSPDGKTLAGGSNSNTIKLWNVETGEERLTLGHQAFVPILSLSFSPDGKTLVSASFDGTIKLWNVATGKERTIKRFDAEVVSLSFSPDGKTLVSSSSDGIIKLWNVATGKELRTIKRDASFTSVSFSPDGKTIGGAVRGPRAVGFTSVSFSPDGKTLISGSNDGTIQLWDVETGKELRTIKGHGFSVTSVSFSLDGKTLTSGSLDKTIKLWDMATGEELRTIKGHDAEVVRISFSPDSTLVSVSFDDRAIRLWNLKAIKEPRTLSEQSVNDFSFSPDGKTLATIAGSGGTIKLWDVATGEERHLIKGLDAGGSSVSFSPDGKTLLAATASSEESIKLWDVATGEERDSIKGLDAGRSPISFSPDGKTLVSRSRGDDKPIKLWDVATGKELHTLPNDDENVFLSFSFSPDGKTLVSGSLDGTIKLWDVATGKELRTIIKGIKSAYVADINSVSFSPDGKTLVSGSLDKIITLWDVATGKELRTIKGLDAGVNSVSFSPDGKTLVSSSRKGTITLWDVATGKELRTIKGLADEVNSGGGEVNSVSFSPDGKTLATNAGSGGTIKLWEIDLNLDSLIERSCLRISNYLQHNPNVAESDRRICDGVARTP